MTILSRDELTTLVSHNSDICLSLFMPTHRSGREQQQDLIRLKNLVAETRAQLSAQHVSQDQTKELLGPVESLRNDEEFWTQRQDGLALFIAKGFFRSYRLPVNLETEIGVHARFRVRPLIQLLLGNARFFLLALSQDNAQLFEATRYSMRRLDLESALETVKRANRSHDDDPSLQFRTHTTERGFAMFHGHGGATDVSKQEILKYFRAVDRAAAQLLRGDDAPLVLACVGFLASIYETANSYSGLIHGKVPGSPGMWAEDELRDRAWDLVSPVLNRRRDQALERLERAAGTDKVVTQLRPLVIAAVDGRIDTLFLEQNRQVWGNVDTDLRAVQVTDNNNAGEELLDFAAAHTLINGGHVYPLDRQPPNMEDSPAVALLRYVA